MDDNQSSSAMNDEAPLPIIEDEIQSDGSNPLETLKNIDKPAVDPQPYVEKTDIELKKIAADIYNDKIFCDRFISPHDSPGMIFMMLMLMTKEQHDEWFADLGMIYEYYSEALPRSVNGMPCFMSMRKLTRSESDRLIGFYDEYKAMQEKIATEWGGQDLSGITDKPIPGQEASDNEY